MSCLDSSLMAALSDDMRKETKPSSVTVLVAASAYLRNPREMAVSSSLTCASTPSETRVCRWCVQTHPLDVAQEGRPSLLVQAVPSLRHLLQEDLLDVGTTLEKLDERLEGLEVEKVVRTGRRLLGWVSHDQRKQEKPGRTRNASLISDLLIPIPRRAHS